MLPVAFQLVFVAIPGCSGPETDSGRETGGVLAIVERLAARGGHEVGYTEGSSTYPDPAGEGDRVLRVAWWYPAAAAAAEHPVYSGLWPTEGAWRDAPAVAGPLPVAVFSHGHQGYAENSSFLAEHLASHGWLVASPDHTGNTVFDGSDRTTAIYYQRPLDIQALLDHLAALPADHLLHGRPGAPTIGVGHSFGGYTMLALAGARFDVDGLEAGCVSDPSDAICTDLDAAALARFEAGFAEPRLAAVVPMAPGDYRRFGAEGIAAITTPVQLMTASEDQPPGSEVDELWAALGGAPHLRVGLEGGGHQSFTDYADLIEDVPLDREEGFRIVNVYVLARALASAGDPEVEAILAGEEAVSPYASLDP